MPNRLLAYFLSIIFLVACTSQPQQPTLQAINTSTQTPSPTSTNTPTPIPTFTPTPTPLPMAGPITENVMTRLGKGWINDLTFSPNGKLLSVATSIGIYLYQVKTMELITFLPSNGFVKTTVFIDNETLVIGASDSTTTVWDIKSTPKLLETLQGNSPVVSLSITDDKTILVVEHDRDKVNVIKWDRTNPESIYPVTSGGYVFDGEYSSAKNILALRTWMSNIILFDTQKMKTIGTICAKCIPFALSQNGNLLAVKKFLGFTKSQPISQMALIDMTSKKEIATFKDGGYPLTFSPDEKLLVSSSATTGLSLWNVETLELVNTFNGVRTLTAAFSPDGFLLASASSDGNLTLRETSTGNILFTMEGFISIGKATFQGEHIASIQGYSSINSYDIAGGGTGGYYAMDGNLILFRNITTGETVRTYGIAEEKAIVESITFSPDGKIMASSWNIDYKDKILVLFDVTTGERLQTLEGVDPIIFSPDGSMMATSAKENQLVIWDIASGKTLPVSLGLVPTKFEPYKKSLVFSPDGSMIAILSDTVIFRDLITGKRIKILESGLDPSLAFSNFDNDGVGAIGEFSPDGATLASTWLVKTTDDSSVWENAKGVAILWDVAKQEKIAILDGHSKPITALAYSPDGTLLATGAKDNTIIVWAAKNGNQLKVLQGHSGVINSLAFSPDSNLLYSNSLDGTVIIWNMKQLLP